MQAIDPCVTPPDPATATVAANAPPPLAAWVFIGALVAILVVELWAGRTGHETISRWLRRFFGHHRWWRPLAIGVIAITLWHLFFGGPI